MVFLFVVVVLFNEMCVFGVMVKVVIGYVIVRYFFVEDVVNY